MTQIKFQKFYRNKNIKSKHINIYDSLNLKDNKGNVLSAKKHKGVKYLNYRMENFTFKKIILDVFVIAKIIKSKSGLNILFYQVEQLIHQFI